MSASAIPNLFPAAPDAATDAAAPPSEATASGFAALVGSSFDGARSALERADGAERAFAAGRGDLQAMVLERAQADVALSIASATASRTAQALTTILGMQI